ncbi:hypothetical protein ACFODQ_01055 [Comamonas sp. JC664]
MDGQKPIQPPPKAEAQSLAATKLLHLWQYHPRLRRPRRPAQRAHPTWGRTPWS